MKEKPLRKSPPVWTLSSRHCLTRPCRPLNRCCGPSMQSSMTSMTCAVGQDPSGGQEHAPADWNSVADELGQRLKQYTSIAGEESFSRNYHRNRLSDWLIKALEQAGHQEEIIPLCEREAAETGSYVRLVNRLKGAGRWGEAEQWIYRGIEATQKRWSGIANELRAALRELREREEDWPRVAAFYAEDFFQQPTLHTFRALQKASHRAGVWPTVQAAAMHYLETGERPQTTERMKKDQVISPWPLPETGLPVSAERRQMSPPMTDTLI